MARGYLTVAVSLFVIGGILLILYMERDPCSMFANAGALQVLFTSVCIIKLFYLMGGIGLIIAGAVVAFKSKKHHT